MKTIVIANRKGGVGKTTLTRNLAVAAGDQAAIIDLDPQGTLTDWLEAREAEYPTLIRGVTAENLTAAIDQLAGEYRYLFVDTPPSGHSWLTDVIRAADLTLIPIKPSPDDLRAVGETLALLDTTGSNFAFVISQAINRARITEETARVLAQHGKVAPVNLHYRVAFAETAGNQGVTEAGDPRSRDEIQQLWKYTVTQLRN